MSRVLAQMSGLHLRVSDAVGVGQGLKNLHFSEVPGGAAAGTGTTV